jgi:hypothetical protein
VLFVQAGRKWVHNNYFLFVFKENQTDKVQTNFHYNLLLSKKIGRESSHIFFISNKILLILLIYVNLKRDERITHNKDMDISDLTKY